MKAPTLLIPLLRRLSHDEFVSGEALASQLGCSRATVHNVMQAAGAVGVVVNAVRGRGYRLADSLDWLMPEMLAEEMEPLGLQLQYFEQLDSTNAYLLDGSRRGMPHGRVVITEQQFQGRGRRGRSWIAPLGQNLSFSLLWRSHRPVSDLSGLSLAVGVIVVRALRAQGLSQAEVKWPNDILVARKKLAGILIELSGDMLGPTAAVIGVGVNLKGADALESELGQPITDVSTHLGEVDRNQIFLALVRGLQTGLTEFESAGFAAFQHEWNACHAFQGCSVDILDGHGDCVRGRARGVDAMGALLLDTPSGVRSFHAGEVSLRGVGD